MNVAVPDDTVVDSVSTVTKGYDFPPTGSDKNCVNRGIISEPGDTPVATTSTKADVAVDDFGV